MRCGLLSVTFRKHAPHAVAALAARAGLDCIEWGGDVHVPHGDEAAAHAARVLTEDAGLRTAAYGSYFRCRADEAFEPVLASALALGAPLIRIWAGEHGSAEAGAATRALVETQARRCVEQAAAHGLTVALEFHRNTLTDTLASCLSLLDAVPGLRSYWQPPHGEDPAQQLAGLRALLPRLAHLHVFHWRMPALERLPLADGASVWPERLRVVASESPEIAAMLEFVRDDSVEQFLEDARTLRGWAKAAQAPY